MFQFTTTTVINSLKDFTTGKDLVVKEGDVILIKRHNPFKVANIDCIVRTAGVDATPDSVAIAYTKDDVNDQRIELYVRSTGNADPAFANALVFKGKPLYIEIPAGTESEDLVKIANKYFNLMFGGTEQLIATVSDNTLTLTCTNGYQRITKATIATRDEEGNFGKGVENGVTVTPGNEGFGDYDHMIKDLRLPTSANLRWKRTMEDEMPTPGALYNQYVLTYTVDRGILGMDAVGQKTVSTTTHIFWVNNAVDANFKKALGLSFTDDGKGHEMYSADDAEAANIVTD